MIVLQAAWEGGRPLFWAEAAADHRRTKARRKRRAEPPPLPFEADPQRLVDALAEILPHAILVDPDENRAVVWLPSTAKRPVASTPLVDEPPAADEAVTVRPWGIAGLRLATDDAIELLCACVGREAIAPGLIIGRSLAYWAIAVRDAGRLVALEKYLPGLDASGPVPRACWQPVLAGSEHARLKQLAALMPPACRAASRTADRPPDTPAVEILSGFLHWAVDQIVRSSPRVETRLAVARSKSSRASAHDSVHDHWVAALTDGDGTLDGADTAELARQIAEWRRPIAVATEAPFRLCFRLEEPPPVNRKPQKKRPWAVRFLLQANDDPSLLVSLADVWAATGAAAQVLRRGRFEPREYTLTALGQAATIWPEVERGLKSARPEGCDLDVTGAHEFLTQRSWMLEQAGFGVLFPAWWSRKGTKQKLSLSAGVKSPKMTGSGFSLNDVLSFQWQVALGGEPISLKELEALAALKAPLVQVRGQWVQLSAEEIQAALNFWRTHPKATATGRELVQMALGKADTPAGLSFDGVRASGWLDDLLTKLKERSGFEELTPPGGFQGQLRPYQNRGFSWLAFLRRYGFGACLADDMGLGKTVQTLALIQRDWNDGERRPVLLACPMSVVGNWQKEAQRFAPDLPVLVHHGLKRVKGDAFRKQVAGYAIVLTSYPLLHRDFDLFRQAEWAGVVLDEAQNIKNPETKQAKAARALAAEWRVALTGTPVENHVGDLWSIMEFLNPGLLGSQSSFRKSFFVPIQASRDPDAAERLQKLTGPFILRRLKTDKSVIADLPDKLEMRVFCTLTKEQASLYQAVLDESARSVFDASGIQRKGEILALLSKLKQVCNHPAQFLGDNSALPSRSGKLARLTEMLEEIQETGERSLVFTQFREMGGLLKKHLEETFGREVLFLHGGTTRKQRDALVARFQAGGDDGPRVFLLSLKAGGTGLNLTAATHVFHFDRWWNPAVENQATDRAFRIGQSRQVQVHKFVCAGTLEEKIDAMIEAKKDIAGRVVGAGEAWLTELSNDQLKDLLQLRAEVLE